MYHAGNRALQAQFGSTALADRLFDELTPRHIFPNCPRYIPNLKSGEASAYVPCAGVERKEPAWKGFDDFKDVVPSRRA